MEKNPNNFNKEKRIKISQSWIPFIHRIFNSNKNVLIIPKIQQLLSFEVIPIFIWSPLISFHDLYFLSQFLLKHIALPC